ncbi:MAG: dipeptidase [Acidobacteriota bacterium]
MPFKFTSRIAIAVALALGASFVCAPVLGTARVSNPTTQGSGQTQDDPALVARARAIHERVITADTHNDISPANFTADCNYTMRLTTQVNLPKMKEGGLDVSFMIVYVGQGPLTPEGYDNAYKQAIAKFDAVHRLTTQLAEKEIGLALTPDDVRKIAASKRKVAVIGVENAYPIGLDIKRVKEFYDRGGRYMSLAHNGHSQLSDSNTGERDNVWLYGGLSPLGKQVIAEMNRLGMMVDVSHPSKASMLQAVALSKAPVIASHSGVRSVANVSRNMDDEMLMALKQNGGVIQMVALSGYVKADPPQRTWALRLLNEEFGVAAAAAGGGRGGGGGGGGGGRAGAPDAAAGAAAAGGRGGGGGRGAGAEGAQRPCPVEDPNATPAAGRGGGGGGGGRGGGAPAANPADSLPADRRAEYDRRLAVINEKWPAATRATVKDFVDHIDYAVKLIGIDHVGISSDFDGGGGITGWNSAAETFNVTLEMVRRGYTEEQIGKIWSGNLLRVWGEVEKVAKQIQAGTLK